MAINVQYGEVYESVGSGLWVVLPVRHYKEHMQVGVGKFALNGICEDEKLLEYDWNICDQSGKVSNTNLKFNLTNLVGYYDFTNSWVVRINKPVQVGPLTIELFTFGELSPEARLIAAQWCAFYYELNADESPCDEIMLEVCNMRFVKSGLGVVNWEDLVGDL